MRANRYRRSIDSAAWEQTDRPIEVPKKLLKILDVPRDSDTYMLWAFDHEQFRDIRQAASIAREVLQRSGLTDALVFSEWFYNVDLQGQAAQEWLSDQVDEFSWWDRPVGWTGHNTLRATYVVDIHDFEQLTLISWNQDGRELLERVRDALLPLPRIPGGPADGWSRR